MGHFSGKGDKILFAVFLSLFQITIVVAQNDFGKTAFEEKVPPAEIRLDDVRNDKIFDAVIFRSSKGVSQYKDIYVDPLTWSENFHGKDMEVIYQLSAKVRMFDMNLYFAYTQKSFWQPFNSSSSSPFRETDYNPELFYQIPPGSMMLNDLGLNIGLEHESNGGSLQLSRSWNRAYITPYYMRSTDMFYMKLWHRFAENAKTTPQDSEGDDNPDILDFYGYTEFHYERQLYHGQHFHMMLRGNYNTGKGAINLIYDIPTGSKDMYYHLSLWNGYGESLIDYNHAIKRIGLGVSFSR